MRRAACIALLAACVSAAFACERAEPVREPEPRAAATAEPAAPAYAGAEACAGCHPGEAERWRGSHHDRAMEDAGPSSVLGDFAGARFERDGVATQLARRDESYFVRTAGPDGGLADFAIAYTFGVEPLQQYLVALPGGRLQVLRFAWDSRPRAQGGQRWFQRQPGERIPPGDLLHWTSPTQNWNAQCAACHSTNLRTGYDPEQGAFTTTWSALDVSCEQCHGARSRHVAWADASARGEQPADPRRGLLVQLPRTRREDWSFTEGAAIARRSTPRAEHAELETCAPCHSRRTQLLEGAPAGTAFLDAYRPAQLEDGLYEADGQILDEVYEWGSFVQSPMYAAGVTCSDCHDPHSLALRAQGNAVCTQCHRAEVFDAPAHHHHMQGTPGASCVACHMPERTYMEIDARRDHSFRVPRPDLSAALGTPNTCNACHRDETAAWAAQAVAGWFPDGRSGEPHFAHAFHAAREAAPEAEALLRAVCDDPLQPALVRASALARLAGHSSPDARAAVRRGLADRDPVVRLGAIAGSEGEAPRARLASLRPLLRDPVRAPRIDAALALAGVRESELDAEERRARAASVAEYRAAQRLLGDDPQGRFHLGVLAIEQADLETARRELADAIRVGPWFVPAYVNLADVERARGDDAAAEPLLRKALAIAPDAAEIHYALGLWLVRNGRRAEAVASLERAAELAPRNERFALAAKLAREEP